MTKHRRRTLLAAFAAGLLLEMTLLTADNGPATTAPATAPATTQPSRVVLPSYGISFIPPAGWTADPAVTDLHVCKYVKIDPDTHARLGEISIGAGQPHTPGQTLAEMGSAFAARDPDRDAVLLPQAFAIDQAPAIAIRKDHGSIQNQPGMVFMAQRPEMIFWFSGHGQPQGPNAELVAMCKTVQWIPRVDASEQLELDKTPRTLDNTGFHIRLPSIFHRDAFKPSSEGSDPNDRLSVGNPLTTMPLASLGIWRMHSKRFSTDAVGPLTRMIHHVEEHADPLVLKLMPPLTGAASDFYDSLPKDKSDHLLGHTRIALVYHGHEDALITFTVIDSDPEHLRRWGKMFDEALKTLTFADPPKKESTTAPARDPNTPIDQPSMPASDFPMIGN